MANFAKVHEKTQILNEDWKKLRVQPVQLMKPVSGHPFLKQVWRGTGCSSSRGELEQGAVRMRGCFLCVLCSVRVRLRLMLFWDAEMGSKKTTTKAFPERVPMRERGVSLCLSWRAVLPGCGCLPGCCLTTLPCSVPVYRGEHLPGVPEPDAVHEDPEHGGTGAHHVLLVPSSAELHGM